MLIISSLLCGFVISAILISIVTINIEKYLESKNIDISTRRGLLLSDFEFEGKDKKDYSNCINKIYIIYVIIFSILSYIILPKL